MCGRAAALSTDKIFPRLFLTALLLFSGSATCAAAQNDTTPQALTDSLLKLNAEHASATEWQVASVLEKMQQVALARHRALLARMATDPGVVLKAALPNALSRRLPGSVQSLLEEEAELEGELEILHEDHPRRSRFHHILKLPDENYSLHFHKNPPSHLRSGTRVRVRGVKLGTAVSLDSTDENLVALAAALPNTLGEQRTLVILVNFADAPAQPYTPTHAQEIVFNNVGNFLLENSYQQTFLSGAVTGWHTISMNSPVTHCDYNQIAAKADAAASAAGVPVSSYSRKLYAFPKARGCGWWGLGTVGGSPSRSWINGDFNLRVVAHELGHNLGLYHSHSLDCGKVALGHLCTISEYGDSMDTMGASAFHFNAFQKERLGWLGGPTSPPITVAENFGSYAVYPFETVDNRPKALKILRGVNPANGRRSYFYAECRRPIGFDAGITDYPSVLDGFLLRIAEENSGNSSYLLDMTPHTASWSDPALRVGQTFSDAVAGVAITPSAPCSDTGNGNIALSVAPGACARSAPEVILKSVGATQSQWTLTGKPVSFVIVVVNEDANCGPANFILESAVPEGWSATFSQPLLTIKAGKKKKTLLTLMPPNDIADGVFSFELTARHNDDPVLQDNASGTIAVVSSLAISAVIETPVLSVPGMAIATVNVNLRGVPVAKARVRLVITRPDGRQRKVRVRTDAFGNARFKYRLRKRFPLGNYQVSATASSRGLDGSTNASFLLQ